MLSFLFHLAIVGVICFGGAVAISRMRGVSPERPMRPSDGLLMAAWQVLAYLLIAEMVPKGHDMGAFFATYLGGLCILLGYGSHRAAEWLAGAWLVGFPIVCALALQ